jgi:hypothetical protein
MSRPDTPATSPVAVAVEAGKIITGAPAENPKGSLFAMAAIKAALFPR